MKDGKFIKCFNAIIICIAETMLALGILWLGFSQIPGINDQKLPQLMAHCIVVIIVNLMTTTIGVNIFAWTLETWKEMVVVWKE